MTHHWSQGFCHGIGGRWPLTSGCPQWHGTIHGQQHGHYFSFIPKRWSIDSHLFHLPNGTMAAATIIHNSVANYVSQFEESTLSHPMLETHSSALAKWLKWDTLLSTTKQKLMSMTRKPHLSQSPRRRFLWVGDAPRLNCGKSLLSRMSKMWMPTPPPRQCPQRWEHEHHVSRCIGNSDKTTYQRHHGHYTLAGAHQQCLWTSKH